MYGAASSRCSYRRTNRCSSTSLRAAREYRRRCICACSSGPKVRGHIRMEGQRTPLQSRFGTPVGVVFPSSEDRQARRSGSNRTGCVQTVERRVNRTGYARAVERRGNRTEDRHGNQTGERVDQTVRRESRSSPLARVREHTMKHDGVRASVWGKPRVRQAPSPARASSGIPKSADAEALRRRERETMNDSYQAHVSTPEQDKILDELREGLRAWLLDAGKKGIDHSLALT